MRATQLYGRGAEAVLGEDAHCRGARFRDDQHDIVTHPVLDLRSRGAERNAGDR